MSRVSNGKVHYLRVKNLGNYEKEEAAVDLDFMVEEGQPLAPALDSAAAEAKLKVLEMLGQTPRERQVAPPVQEAHDPNKPVEKRPRRTKEQMAADEAAKQPAKDPTAVEDDAAMVSTGAISEAVKQADPTAMDEDFDSPTGQTREIPDKELSDACGAAAKKTNNPKAVRDYIAELALPPGGSKSIPQARRAEFLAGLEKIPVVAAE
jgi:hypothetical protein